MLSKTTHDSCKYEEDHKGRGKQLGDCQLVRDRGQATNVPTQPK